MSIASRHVELPIFPTPFVGREAEYAMLRQSLCDPACHLVSVVGMGGVGKSRLAIEVATSLTANHVPDTPFPDGVFFVPLAALSPGSSLNDQLATTIAAALDLQLAGPDIAPLQLRHYLRDKALLLDNVEHLMAGVHVFADLLHVAPALKLLVTSREGTRLRGECVIELSGLPYPDAEETLLPTGDAYAAIRCFLLLARAHTGDQFDARDDLRAISRICGLVGGLPLGIELAASWTRFLSCVEIADEVATNRDVLADSIADVPERRRSLSAVFRSSWELLTSDEQRALRQLAVFQGSFTRDAALAVAETTFPQLASLINKSLVRRVVVSWAT